MRGAVSAVIGAACILSAAHAAPPVGGATNALGTTHDVRSVFPEDRPAPRRWEGPFDAIPVPYWTAPAPGGRLASAAHTERGQPVFDGERIYLGTAAGKALFAIDRRNGVLVQSYPAAASVQAAPTLEGDVLWFGDAGGMVWSYTKAGRPRWTYDAGAPVLVAPTVHEGVVYVATVDDLVLALNADDGTLLWRAQHRTDLTRKTELALYAAPPVVVRGDVVLAGFSDGAVTAYLRDGGEAVWQRRIGEGRYPDVVAAPIVAEDLVFVSGYFEPLAALDAESGRTVWTAPYGSAARPVLIEGLADGAPATLLVQPGTDGALHAYVARTGDEVWTWQSGSTGALTTPSATAAGLLLGRTDASVVLVDAATGTTRWVYRTDRGIDGVAVTPVVDGRQAVFITNAGTLHSVIAPHRPRASAQDDGVRVDLGAGRPLR